MQIFLDFPQFYFTNAISEILKFQKRLKLIRF